jgi:hypothetical protein
MENKNMVFSKNVVSRRFEAEIEELTAYIEYTDDDHGLVLSYTHIPDQLLNTGVVKALIEKTFALIQEDHNKIMPVDILVREYLNSHPQYKGLVYENCVK